MKPGVKVKLNFLSVCGDKISVIKMSTNVRMFLLFLFTIIIFPVTQCADLVIRIPHDLSQQDGFYRLDYKPTVGIPPANTTFRPAAISDVIEFSRGAPGTKYEFKLYYSNSSLADWLTWTASITTAPDPPSNLSIDILSGKIASIQWRPPSTGGYSGFKLKVIPLSEPSKSIRNIVIREDASPFQLRDLTPGATYEIQLFTVYENKESTAYISTNFTTRPNTPGRFIVWFRNETTLLVLWQPPYPAGVYTDYKVSIDPRDALTSETYVAKEGEPPGPAQAAFNDLVPGRAYNISVETVSEGMISDPTTAQYRTVPWRPSNVTFDQNSIDERSFEVRWDGPTQATEFDRYQVAIGIRRKTPQNIDRGAPLRARFQENLKPGRTYQVVVKTVSGSVASWPATGNVTTRPLPVRDPYAYVDEETKETFVAWQPNPESYQDGYKITYHELEPSGFELNGDSSSVYVPEEYFSLSNLQPGRNYSISVRAVSKGIESVERSIFQATRPASPIVERPSPLPGGGLQITWKSDVTSRQEEYAVVYVRNDTKTVQTIKTRTPRIKLENLYPGAGYEIKVFALSHGLESAPHISFTAVFPNPPRNLTILKVQDNRLTLKWLEPVNSLYSGYTIRYRPYPRNGEEPRGGWTTATDKPITTTEYVLSDLSPGEHFQITVDAVSHHVTSGKPLVVSKIISPQSVSNIRSILDAENVTLVWPRPEGRVDMYRLKWYMVNDAENVSFKTIPGNIQTEGISRKVSVLIPELHPGVEYMFHLTTEANNLKSETLNTSIRTMPFITSSILLINTDAEVTTALKWRYTPTPRQKSVFDTYRFAISDQYRETNITPIEKSEKDPNRLIEFSNLIAGRLYNITMWTVSVGVTSRPLERQDRLYPEPVSGINATRITNTEIRLVWQVPRGDYDGFELKYIDDYELQNARNHLVKKRVKENTITIKHLRPFRNYTFTIVTIAGGPQSIPRNSLPISAIFATKESVPGSLTEFKALEIEPRKVQFQWKLPSVEANGIITGFVIHYGPVDLKALDVGGDAIFSPTNSSEFGPNIRQGTIDHLKPGRTYAFQIKAKTKVGFGSPVQRVEEMPIWAPPLFKPTVSPRGNSHSMTTVQIEFNRNFFLDTYGVVISYAVLVAEDYTKPTVTKLNLARWQDVHHMSPWPPYQASELFYPFHNSTNYHYTIGTGNNCQSKPNYCNGPLKPGTEYRFKIRAYTTREQFSESQWSSAVRTDHDNTTFLVGIIIPIILLIVAVIVIFTIRRIRNKRNDTSENPGSGTSCVKMRHMGHNDNISLPDSVIETSKPVKLKDFSEHYRIMSADSDFRFSEEYEELKHVGREKPCSAADMPVNRPKNRFTNILPYDHSRVKLQPTDDEEGSDFINANFVPGHNSPREFIVTQGPLHSTRDDFWRMCWETNSRGIVMLTRCVEKGREKCDHYWPYDTQPVYYGDIQVTILNESHFPDWNISEFRIMRGDTVRKIKHFHFTTWPDFGVPEPPQTLVRFVRAYRQHLTPEQTPVVVHCSAGVGRSGTFIALDKILQQILHSDVVDIFGIVYEMRRERVWMVQTEQQYICIHQCLLAVLDGRENEPAMHEIHENEGFEDDEGIAESGM